VERAVANELERVLHIGGGGDVERILFEDALKGVEQIDFVVYVKNVEVLSSHARHSSTAKGEFHRRRPTSRFA